MELDGKEAQIKLQHGQKEDDYEPELGDLDLQTFNETPITPSPTRQLK